MIITIDKASGIGYWMFSFVDGRWEGLPGMKLECKAGSNVEEEVHVCEEVYVEE